MQLTLFLPHLATSLSCSLISQNSFHSVHFVHFVQFVLLHSFTSIASIARRCRNKVSCMSALYNYCIIKINSDIESENKKLI